MNTRTGRLLYSGLPLLAFAASGALAQDASPTVATVADDDTEIVVTARRLNEKLENVPASITVLSADTLENANLRNAQDFAKFTPGVTIVTSTAEAGDTQINIRGINGARDAESSVALVVDGILKTNTASLNQRQGTLRQVEILKGPQGALYGRNAAAGAIVIQTVKPSDRFEGSMEASYANEQTATFNGYIAGPIADGIGFVLAGDYATTDGFYRNILLDRKVVDDQKSWSLDGRIVGEVGSSTKIDAKLRYGELHGASINFNAAFHLPLFASFNPAFNEDVNEHPFNFYSNIRPKNDQKTFEASFKIDHDFGPATLTAWTLYSDIKNNLEADGTSADFARYIGSATGDGQAAVNSCFASTTALTGFPVNQPGFIGQIPVPFLFAPANGSTFGPYAPTTCDGTQYQIRNQRDISAEIRLSSNGTGPFEWQLGGYYLHINRTVGVSLGADTGAGIIRNLYNDPTSANPTSQLFHDRFRTNVYAAFASGQWKPTDTIDVGIALRYDIEKRSDDNLVPFVLDPFTGGPINPGQVGGPIASKSATFKQFEPKITLRWEIAPRTNLFANWGVGFKSGGFNNQGAAAIVAGAFNDGITPGTIDADVSINDLYDKERSSAFEGGIKGVIGPISYNLAGYYTRVTNMQFFEFFVGSFGLLRVVSNIDRVDIKGLEANIEARPMTGWTIYGAFNATDSKIKKNSSRPYTVGNKSPYTADWTLNIGSQIELPLDDQKKYILRADYRVTGPTWFHSVQNQDRPTLFTGLIPISAVNFLPASFGNANYNVARRDTFGVLDLRVGIQGERWKAILFANNVMDKKYLNEVIPAIEFGGSFISPGARRLWGLEVGYRF